MTPPPMPVPHRTFRIEKHIGRRWTREGESWKGKVTATDANGSPLPAAQARANKKVFGRSTKQNWK